METGTTEWTQKPLRNIHITVREPDMADFDPERFVATLIDLKCNFVTLLTGGYHSIYRSEIPLVRNNPYLTSRDLLGELIEGAHTHGIKIGACVDVSAVPRIVYDHYPEWFVRNPAGEPYIITAHPVELYAACPIAGYLEKFVTRIVEEHLRRYDFDHFNLTGFGFGAYGSGICHCRTCSFEYREATGSELPLKVDGADANWKRYMSWRSRRLQLEYKKSLESIKKLKPSIATWINQGYDITETPFAPLEALSSVEDFVKTEAQTKIYFDSLDSEIRLPPIWQAAEQGRYFNTISDRKVITTTSYYFAWPWRKTAAPDALEKMWIAEAAANNVNPFVHVSGFPQHLDDRRGMAPVREMFHFLADNEEYYADVTSYTNIALFLSQETMNFHAGEELRSSYSQHFRGAYKALAESHFFFDIIGEGSLDSSRLSKYRLLVLPNATVLSDDAISAIREFVAEGGGLISSYETSLFDASGNERADLGLSDVFGCSIAGGRLGPLAGTVDGSRIMAYLQLSGSHPLTAGLGDTDIVPNAGYVRMTRAAAGASVPLTVQLPAKVFPEGEAWVPSKMTDIPGAVANTYGNGKSVYFTGMIDRMYQLVGHPDHRRLFANAVKWMLGDENLVELESPVTVDISIQQQVERGRLIAHLINLTGNRPQGEIIPVFGMKLRVKVPVGLRPESVVLASSREELDFRFRDGMLETEVQRLDVYDLVAIQLGRDA